VSAEDSNTEGFDVFLCHNSEDKPAVREIGQKLAREGVKPWLDEEQIRPGTTWQTVLGEQIKSIKSAAVFVGNGGIGPWQNEEIQAFLNEFIERKCPLIPAIFASAKTTPELPWTLKHRHRVDFRLADPDPLKQLIWGITGQKPEAEGPLIPGIEEQETSRKAFSETRLYPPLVQRPDPDQATQLEILRRRVKEYWVDGVLKHSLYNEVLISLGMRHTDEFVDAPWKYTVEVSDAVNSPSLGNRDISAIYDATGLLLVLGEPGSGKTTTLLDLARTLLDRAGQDIRERVPIVLNLSSWKRKQPLVEWMSGELSDKYRVPRKIARSWLQNRCLLPLLDGLDEVETILQPDCVAAVNAFIGEFNPSGLVVCCRLNEYRWLPERLKLNGAISLEPLVADEIEKYLVGGGPKLAPLCDAVNTDPVLCELAETPLMLSIMSLAFQGSGSEELARRKGNSPKERRKQIFHLYVEEMFQRKGTTSPVFPKDKTIVWLSWLAANMRKHSQSVFLVEGLQPSWLVTRVQRAAYGTVAALSFGVVSGLSYALNSGVSHGLSYGPSWSWIFGLIVFAGVALGCWSESSVKNGFMSGLIIGLFFLLIGGLISGLTCGLIGGLIGGLGVGSLNHITTVETMSWKWNRFWIPGLIVGSIVGLFLWWFAGLSHDLTSGVNLALTYGLIVGLTTVWLGGFTDSLKVGKASPNQGIKLSRRNSLTAFLITCLIYGLSYLPLYLLISPRISRKISGLGFGLTLVMIFALNRGGSAVIKHYALRLILWTQKYTPLNFVAFLDHCAKLILLKKVGGGYIFIHRMLLDYFAELTPESINAGDTTTGSKLKVNAAVNSSSDA
jgi:eukaryotic-like serine/threonine-protein kinase